MSKSEEYRLKLLKEDNHTYRKRKAQQLRELNEQDAKEQLRSIRCGEYDKEQRTSVHEDE